MSQFDYKPFYRRNLPHLQPLGAKFFVTFRLEGSLPQSVVRKWNLERQWLAHLYEVNRTHYEKVKDDFDRTWFRKFESLLDGATVGLCGLKIVALRPKLLKACIIETVRSIG
jgi:hypothetical protein